MIVIPMAGLSRRFSEAGYSLPKFMLDLHGQTLFAHSVRSFEAYFKTETFLFIVRDEPGFANFIQKEVTQLGIAAHQIVLLERPTNGQAETVQRGLVEGRVSPDAPITIFNIDTFRPGFRYPEKSWMSHADGYLEVIDGCSDPAYSYVLPASDNEICRVAETAEKVVISQLGSTGLYWFRRAKNFMRHFSQSNQPLSSGELYVAPIYNSLIGAGLDIRYEIVDVEDVIFCGIPQQYQKLLSAGYFSDETR